MGPRTLEGETVSIVWDMRITDLVYGPRYRHGSIRPTTVDMDTVRDITTMAKKRFDDLHIDGPPAEVTYQVGGIPHFDEGSRVPEADLDQLSSHDRNTLVISVVRTHAEMHLSFLVTAYSALSSRVGVEGLEWVGDDLRAKIQEKILNDGVPIWRPHLLLNVLPLVVGGIFVALWLWLSLSTELPLPAILLGWLITVCAVAAAFWASARLRKLGLMKVVRHRIRDESRSKTYARRADEKRDAKVLIMTAIVALPSGFFLAILTNAFGLTT